MTGTGAAPLRVGFVGLRDQGEPMASRILAAGHQVTVWARRPVQTGPLVAAGAARADDVRGAAAASDLFAICVGDDSDVEEVFAAALPGLQAGSIVVVHSTIHPETCRRLAARAHQKRVAVLDAPVSGGRQRAFDGRLTVMVGGDVDTFTRAQPVMATFGELIVHVGPLGAGELLKLVNNYLFTAHLDVAHQTVELLEQLGLDVAGAARVIAASTGSSRVMEWFAATGAENVFPRHMKGRAHGAALLAKDIALLRSLLPAGSPARLDQNVSGGVEMAVAAGRMDDDGGAAP